MVKLMRQKGALIPFSGCIMFAMLLASCGHGTYTQTFVDDGNSSRTLTLTRQVGFVRPAANFPHSLFFKLFGTDELHGTYVLVDGVQKVEGAFTAGKDGDSQWIKFTASGKPEWSVKAGGGGLVGPGDTTWSMKSADAKTAQSFKVGE
jgi:hypothetical protein